MHLSMFTKIQVTKIRTHVIALHLYPPICLQISQLFGVFNGIGQPQIFTKSNMVMEPFVWPD